jgi:hypothetical protein
MCILRPQTSNKSTIGKVGSGFGGSSGFDCQSLADDPGDSVPDGVIRSDGRILGIEGTALGVASNILESTADESHG